MICNNCGETFAPEDVVLRYESHGFTDGFAETLFCCPFCGSSDLMDTESCDICGKEFPDGESCYGFCLGCLWEAIDYDVALEYMKSGLEDGWLAQFILGEWFGAQFDDWECSTDALDAFLEETFKRLVADEKLRTALSKVEKPKFLEACRLFCLPYYPNGDFGVDGQQFAEWYARREKEAKP